MIRDVPMCLAIATVLALASGEAGAQVRLDRADPTISERALPQPSTVPQVNAPVPSIRPNPVQGTAPSATPRVARAIVVDGNVSIATDSFAYAISPFIGRDLAAGDLSALARAVAEVARSRGYPFATASIGAQPMNGGILRVTLDEGRIDVVRVIGATNPAADRILAAALTRGRPLRRGDLERAIQLVGDLPGVRVTESKFIRQDGFGILLVTIVEDRASAYVQIDNRGSREIGPLRSTILASLRGIAGAGDELGLIAANTPIEPSEFAFLRARYSLPAGTDGGRVAISASYGHARPGALLRPLDIAGNSVDVSASYIRPLVRSRAESVWAGVEFRALRSDQALSGFKLRDDRLATLTGTLTSVRELGQGSFRGEFAMVAGLPFDGVTREGDPLASRSDGDARFVTFGYTAEWTTKLGEKLGLVVASSGQVATRPLLATAEIGNGGPAFGRGYDYAERTGDQGILGSVEVRGDAGRVVPGVVERLQVYAFVDGGHVSNLRRGIGGGSLLSTGTGLRFGLGIVDGMVEVALPLNADRFDTGDRRPRFSFRLSRSF